MTIQDLKTRWASKIHGASVNKIKDPYGLIFEAAGNVLLKCDPYETKRIMAIQNAIYTNIYDYVIPSDVKGDAVIDLQPQTPRQPWDGISQSYDQQFDHFKAQNSLVIKNNSGYRTIRISKVTNPVTTVNLANDLTANGTWTTGGNATSLALDTFQKVDPTASLRFNISASGSVAYLQVVNQTAVDLSLLANTGSFFLWAYVPNTTAITSFTLEWGSSTLNFYTAQATTAQDATGFVVGWNLMRFDWSTAVQTGTPVTTAINFIRVQFNYNGTAVPSCRINDITASVGGIYNLVYYSSNLFQDTTGIWKSKPTVDTDIINLSIQSYNLLQYECDFLLAQELQGKDGEFDADFWEKKGQDVYAQYNLLYKSERLKPRVPYYRMKITNHRRRR